LVIGFIVSIVTWFVKFTLVCDTHSGTRYATLKVFDMLGGMHNRYAIWFVVRYIWYAMNKKYYLVFFFGQKKILFS
jgi:hypothetical protein